jgi:cytosine/adenosine deaminase-related metal-dependent hydrolase
VLVEGNRIAAVGPRAELAARFPQAEQVGDANMLLLPAFVNAHDHGRAIGTAQFGVADDLLEIWLMGLGVQPALDPYLAAAYDGLRLLQSGVTTVAHSHNPRSWETMAAECEPTLRGYRDVGIRVAFHPPLVDQNLLVYADHERFLAGLPPGLRDTAQAMMQPPPLSRDDYLALCADLYRQHHDAEGHMVHIQISPAGGQWCSDELILASVEFARQHQTRVQMHMLETRYQAMYAERRWGKSFIRHLDEIGTLGPTLTLAHMVWVGVDDLALLAERGVGIAHNPSSNLRLRSGIAPLAEMARNCLHLGIGLDGHGLDDDQDYLRELRLAWTLANRPGADEPMVYARDILHMGTRGGAEITLPGAPLGKLAEGWLADLQIVDCRLQIADWFCSSSEQAPIASPQSLISALLRRASRRDVRHVMCNGRWVVRDGVSATLDEAAIVAGLRECIAGQDPAALRESALRSQALAPYIRRFYAAWEETRG